MAIPNRRATVGALYEAVNELPDWKKPRMRIEN
jgi:hypothetical protein